MATFDYQGFRDTVALPLLLQFGDPTAVLSRVVPGVYDPVTDEVTGETTDEHTVSVVFGKFKKDETLGGVIPQPGDSKIIIGSEEGFVAEPNDTISVGGETYRIEGTQNVAPEGVISVIVLAVGRPQTSA